MNIVIDLATRVVETLCRKSLFITTVESCTGGGLANALTNIPGASEIMRGGLICYSNEQKIIFGVSREMIEKYGVYSIETAIAMAESGIRAIVRADIGVGITGSLSRVDLLNLNSSPGEVYIAVKYGNKVISQKFVLEDNGDRPEIKEQIIIEALKMVLQVLI